VTDWSAIIAADFAIPASGALPELTGELLDALCSPDPALRDEQAYPVLTAWIVAGHLDDQLSELGDRVIRLLAHPQIQARTFAALILAALVHRDTAAAVLDTPAVLRWRDDFADWWLAETDLRGWDEERGWLHAMAHGADVIGELGLSPRLDGDTLAGLLDLTCARLLAPTSYVLAHQEDDRVALAMATVLTRPELPEAAATGWLSAVNRSLERQPPGPVPAPIANTIRTLRSLYLMADRGFRPDPDHDATCIPPHQAKIVAALGDTLHLAFPHQL
jgi:Protein of unknown function (DUF2785)